MKNIVGCLGLFIAASVTGCVAPTAVERQAQENFRAIQEGQSTRDDVLKLLGRPAWQTIYSRMGEEVWDYRYLTTWHMLLSVHFAIDTGKVKYYTNIPDPAFNGSRGR
jgi:outer membrane protein assembly factor BamE (lipoprotein component of BamABCDE complex)